MTLGDRDLAGRTGKGIRVAVVDSGIAPNHPHVGAILPGVNLVGDPADTSDRIGHGTAVAAAIRDIAPGVELVPVRVFDRELKTDVQTLGRAIAWADEHECRIVNLSLGTSNPSHESLLRNALETMGDMVVVAAYKSGDTRWLPGSLAAAFDSPGRLGVIGVLPDPEMARDTIYADAETGFSQIRASIYPRPIPGVPRERNLHGLSFAVANATGFVALRLEGSRRSG